MLFIIIVIVLVLLILLLRYISLTLEMKQVRNELERIRLAKTDEYVQMNLSHRTLEQLVSELNELIESKQEIRGEAVRSERELTNMITSMSHDLRTPLTAIIGYIQLLEQSDIHAEDYKRYVAIIHTRATQLHALVQSFFALSALQNDEEPLDLEHVDMTDIVQACALSYYDAFQENEQSVELVLPESPCFVVADVTACKRIIENLILNAHQHASKHVTISLESSERAVSFTVRNTVQTNRRLDETRLFDRLYTADTTRRRHRGLGLPIVNRLMEQMNGRIETEVTDDLFIITCIWEK